MKKQYIQPATLVAAARVQAAFLAGSGEPQATYGGGKDGNDHSQTDNIGTAGDDDEFTMESKHNTFNVWED